MMTDLQLVLVGLPIVGFSYIFETRTQPLFPKLLWRVVCKQELYNAPKNKERG